MKIGSIHIKYWSRNNGVVSVISSTYESPVTFTKDNIQEDSELLQRLQEAKEGRSLRWQSSHQVIYVFFDVRPKDDDPEILEAYNIIGITEMSQDDFLAKISADEYRIMLQNLLRDKAEILPLLKAYPLAAKRDPPIIQLYNPEALKGLKWFFQHPENFQLFWTNLQNEKARRELALFADTDFLYEHLEYLDNSRLKDYIININWNDFTHTTLALRQKILPALTWTEHKDIAQEIILGMDRDGTLLDLNIWKCLPDITLVKLIIYISNQKNLLLTHENEINELLDYYSKDNNLILTALLKFCTILYYQEFTEKQCAFEAADAILMSYFWHESIMQSKGIPACLDILLDKCRHYYGKDAYCDARFIYKKGEEGQRQAKVWCPINFRGYCMCFNSTDLENHDLIEQKPAFQQTFSNFLCNVCDSFSPNITKYRMDAKFGWHNYFYRINAYINVYLRVKQHLRCRYCHAPLYPDMAFAKKVKAHYPVTRFNCVNASLDLLHPHDKKVYINACANSQCDQIIDSRECKQKTGYDGTYLCMYCGASGNPDSYHVYKAGEVCPSCFSITTIKYPVKVNGQRRVVCFDPNCMHNITHIDEWRLKFTYE